MSVSMLCYYYFAILDVLSSELMIEYLVRLDMRRYGYPDGSWAVDVPPEVRPMRGGLVD